MNGIPHARFRGETVRGTISQERWAAWGRLRSDILNARRTMPHEYSARIYSIRALRLPAPTPRWLKLSRRQWFGKVKEAGASSGFMRRAVDLTCLRMRCILFYVNCVKRNLL